MGGEALAPTLFWLIKSNFFYFFKPGLSFRKKYITCSFVTGGCTNLKIDTLPSQDISTGHDNVVKAVQPLLYLNCNLYFTLIVICT